MEKEARTAAADNSYGEAAEKESRPILDHLLGVTNAGTPTGESAESPLVWVGPNREAAPAKKSATSRWLKNYRNTSKNHSRK